MDSSILLVDDDPGTIQLMGRILSGMGQLRFATSGAAALQRARECPPDLMLLDAEMPGLSGYEVCEALQADASTADVPVIFVTAHGGPEFELKGLNIGAVDFIAKPISEPLLVARVRTQLRIKRLTDELRRIATIDALTEVLNRRSLDEALAREWQRGLRAGDPISLLMVDVDHFKLFNDHHGHPAGDSCLRAVAQALGDATQRAGDLVARYGGEEFALLLPRTPRAGAEHLAQRLHGAIEALGIPHPTSPTASHLTVSIGIGCCDAASDARVPDAPVRSSADLLRSADQALYAAKRNGRARTWWLDMANADTPAMAREVARTHRPTLSRRVA